MTLFINSGIRLAEMNDNCCNICREYFTNARGLHCHNIRNIGHPQDELPSKSSSSTVKEQLKRKQKSLVVIEQQLSKKTSYADIDKTNSAIEIEFNVHDIMTDPQMKMKIVIRKGKN